MPRVQAVDQHHCTYHVGVHASLILHMLLQIHLILDSEGLRFHG